MTVDAKKCLSCFLSIARTIAGPMEYETVIKNIANGLATLIPHDHLDFVLLKESGYQVCYEANLHTSWSEPTATAVSPIRDVLQQKIAYLLTQDAWEDERQHFEGSEDAPIFEANLRSRVVVPLRVQGDVIGSLAVSSHDVARYTEDDVETVQGVADLISAYLFALERGQKARESAVAESEARGRAEALRIGAQQLTAGMESERQRISMDIHDQSIADLARLSRRVSRFQQSTVLQHEELSGIEQDLSSCLNELRRIVEDMKPGVLQLFGFNEAVEAHMHRCTKGKRLPIEAVLEDSAECIVDRFSDNVRTALYRITQEAINNAITHSGATKISVNIDTIDKTLKLTIGDNGRGLENPAISPSSGIDNIHTRAALISAQSMISSIEDGCGTLVTVLLPLEWSGYKQIK